MSRDSEIAALWREIAALKGERVRYIEATVTAADPDSSTFTVDVPDGIDVRQLSGIASPPQFLPAEGDVVRVSLAGAQPIYEPSSMPGLDTANVGNLAGLNVTDDPRIMGDTFSTHLDRKAQIVAWTFDFQATGPTTDEIGIIDLAWQAKQDHAYLVLAGGLIPEIGGGGDRHAVPFWLRLTTDGSAPLNTSYPLARTVVETRYDLNPWENPTATVSGLHKALIDHTARVTLTIQRPIGATYADLYVDNNLGQRYLMVLDMGLSPGDAGQVNHAGGTLYSAPPPPAPPPTAVVDDETIFTADWVSNFRGDGSYVAFSEAYQGLSPNYPANGNMRSFIGFTDMQGPLAGKTIRYAKVWVWYGHWHYNDGGVPRIDVHANDGQVFTPTDQFGIAFDGPWLGRGSGAWIDLPVSWGEAFRDGIYKGIALGPGPSTDPKYYGRANGPGQYEPPRIAVGWTG